MMKSIYKDSEVRMKKTISVLEEDLTVIRAGRANPALLERISLDYYGVPTPITQVGNVSVPEARLLVIQPWDTNIIKEIEKAILKSDLGITPNNDGKVIRLSFPPLTEERRKKLVKDVSHRGEEAKIAIRSIRRDTLEQYRDMEKKSEISEDNLRTVEKEVQELTDDYVGKVDLVIEAKEKDILEV